MKLHLGCGNKKIAGMVNIDSVLSCQPDLLHDLAKPLPYQDLSIDEILAEDLLEHFDKYMRFIVLGDWVRVLKIGGIITLRVPNFQKILFRYFKFNFDNFVDFLFGENLWHSEVYSGHFGMHKWGYSEESLKKFVEQFGCESVEVKKIGLNLRLVAKKVKHISVHELDEIMIYSFANQSGPGPGSVSLKFVRSRIEEFQRESGNGSRTK